MFRPCKIPRKGVIKMPFIANGCYLLFTCLPVTDYKSLNWWIDLGVGRRRYYLYEILNMCQLHCKKDLSMSNIVN